MTNTPKSTTVVDDGTLDVICQENRSPYSGDLWETPYLGNDYWAAFGDLGQPPEGRGIIGSPALPRGRTGTGTTCS